MKTFTQPAITGYRQLSEADAAVMDKIKKHAEETRELVGEVQKYRLSGFPCGFLPCRVIV